MSDLMQVHRSERMTVPGGAEIDVDVEMVPLIRRLWDIGLRTNGCCQDFGESILSNGHQSTTTDDDRARFVAFYRGQAWLKMPTGDAKWLISAICENPAFTERLTRWTHPEAWMNIVYIFPSDYSAALAKTAQLHFPRVQIPELVEALAGLHRN